MADDRRKQCMKRALMRLSMSDMTAVGMYKYLTDFRPDRDNFDTKTAEYTVKKLISQGFIDDKRFFHLYLERLDARLFGPRRIREELYKRNFSAKFIEKAARREIDYHQRAKELLEKRKSEKLEDASRENTASLVRFLVSNGYDYTLSFDVVEEILNR